MDLVEVPRRTIVHRHPWEQARFAFFLRVLRSAGVVHPGASALDVGAGDGWFARELAARIERADVVAWDTGYASRGCPEATPGVRFTERAPAARFEAILLLDVVEHVEDDLSFTAGVVREHLADGGRVLVSVPAWPGLFSSHDVHLGHVRRYTPRAGRELLERAGLRVLRAGGLFHSLVLPRWIQARRERRRGGAARHVGEWTGGALTTAVVRSALECDALASDVLSRAGLEVPGLSWWALCRAR